MNVKKMKQIIAAAFERERKAEAQTKKRGWLYCECAVELS